MARYVDQRLCSLRRSGVLSEQNPEDWVELVKAFQTSIEQNKSPTNLQKRLGIELSFWTILAELDGGQGCPPPAVAAFRMGIRGVSLVPKVDFLHAIHGRVALLVVAEKFLEFDGQLPAPYRDSVVF